MNNCLLFSQEESVTKKNAKVIKNVTHLRRKNYEEINALLLSNEGKLRLKVCKMD